MFKKIQNHLLIKHPLLWNIKIVPLTFYSILFHIIFFIIGYNRGDINFTETDNNYSYDSGEGTLIFFSVLISILALILWCVYYFKNNSLKSFYPKNNLSIFKEWIILFFGSLLIVTFLVSYFYGKDVKVRSYFSEIEAKKRSETLAMGSFFVNGSYSYFYNNNTIDSTTTIDALETKTTDSTKEKDFFIYKGKKYSYNSLLNKNINSYSFINEQKDSILKERIKTWLVTNQKDSVLKVFKDYLIIAKDHNLKASIDAEKWLDLTYDYPTFEKYKTIGKEERDFDYNIEYNTTKINSTEQYFIKGLNGEKYLYNKFYVPESQLNHAYKTISDSYNNPTISWQSFLIAVYFAIAISLMLLSFRVTSGKNWLIALISLGITNILIGILTAIFKSQYVYLTTILLIFIATLIYFLIKIAMKKSKGISGITLNITLWILPAFAPIIYYLILEIAKEISGYNSAIGQSRDVIFPKITYFRDEQFIFYLFYLNVVFVALGMLFFSRKIKQWRGIAEN